MSETKLKTDFQLMLELKDKVVLLERKLMLEGRRINKLEKQVRHLQNNAQYRLEGRRAM